LFSADEAHSGHPPDIISVAALFYLTLPNLIFLGGWLKPFAAAPIIALVTVAIVQLVRREDIRWSFPISPLATSFVVVSGFAWASLGGAGHFFHANIDWLIRDKVLGDLTFSAWPPAYGIVEGHHHILRSAIGYFLPAAVVGKWLGIGYIDLALYCWTGLGTALFLLLLPLPNRVGLLLITLIIITVTFSGMDYLGIFLITGDTPIFPLTLAWWVPFNYSPLAGQLLAAPNHALPLWLVTALFFRHWGHRAWPALFMVMLPLTVVWTPFAVAGIFPFLILATIRWFSLGNSFQDARITAWQLASTLALSFLMLRFMSLDIGGIPGAPTVEVAPNPNRFGEKYLLFVLVEFGILALLLARTLEYSFGILWIACGILLLLPLYQYGPSNDTMLRLSTPSLVFLLLLTLDRYRNWANRRTFPATAWAITLVLLVGACTPFNEIWRTLLFKRTPPNYGTSLIEQAKNTEPPHYVGRLNRADLIAVLRTPSLVPVSTDRYRQGLWPVPAPKPR
jgi:hypothetical protein